MLDTNVYLSALISPAGPPARIVDLWLDGRFDVVSSDPIEAEVLEGLEREKIRRYIRRSPDWIRRFLRALRQATIWVEPAVVDVIPQDPPDNLVIGTAIAGAVDFVVSGNRHLLELGNYESIQIVTPRRFLDAFDAST
ncbi:MAG: putative toxin-antitoxin system toxin component, PIN family [Dehalococcoidia bacterium]